MELAINYGTLSFIKVEKLFAYSIPFRPHEKGDLNTSKKEVLQNKDHCNIQ